MAGALLRDVSYQFLNLPIPQNDFSGKVAIITGSNTGLDLETARTIAKLNAEKVILAVRNLAEGDIAKADIERSINRSGVIEVWPLDLLSFKSVQDFASRVEELPRLDVVIQNAAINAISYREAEGHESSVTVNVLSTFLLTLNLLPKLRNTAFKFSVVPHIVIVSSAVHFFTSYPQSSQSDICGALNDRQNLKHGRSIQQLAARIADLYGNRTPIVINTVDPGICKTDLTREFTGVKSYIVWGFSWLLARTAEAGSRTIVFAADSGVETHAKYIGSCKILE
ncbi:hypothetical protein F5884DRAFT_824334 [Xylogone sp. PMI_703]|nr:hypothetical protein F5884DRAFT_824334 [Xylogone sp. PMI_703]